MLAIISGPEPQRSLFEDSIVQQAKLLPDNFIIVRGLSEQQTDTMVAPNIRMISHLPGAVLFDLIVESSIIISRGGYTTLMDLAGMNKRCIFVPTPGQTEQEYLVQALAKNGLVIAARQSTFNLAASLEKAKTNKGYFIPSDPQAFKAPLQALIVSVQSL